MNKVFEIRGYWGGRTESVEKCAERAYVFFTELARCNELFARWYLKGNSRKEALATEVEASKQAMVSLIAKGVAKQEFSKKPLPEMGYSFGLWTGGGNYDSAAIRVCCGRPPSAGRAIVNSCCIILPTEGPSAADILSLSVAKSIFEAYINGWDPDWIVYMPNDVTISKPLSPNRPLCGLYNYVSRSIGNGAYQGRQFFPISSSGWMIIASENDRLQFGTDLLEM